MAGATKSKQYLYIGPGVRLNIDKHRDKELGDQVWYLDLVPGIYDTEENRSNTSSAREIKGIERSLTFKKGDLVPWDPETNGPIKGEMISQAKDKKIQDLLNAGVLSPALKAKGFEEEAKQGIEALVKENEEIEGRK